MSGNIRTSREVARGGNPPLWFALSRQWLASGGTTGLTIPFLVGAQARNFRSAATGNVEIDSLSSLLYSMQRACPEDYAVRIDECWRLKQPVAQIALQQLPLDVVELVASKKQPSRLYVSQRYRHRGCIETATMALWQSIGEPVALARFSFVDGAYREFSAHDFEFIDRAIGNNASAVQKLSE